MHDMATHTFYLLAGGLEASRQWRKEGKGQQHWVTREWAERHRKELRGAYSTARRVSAHQQMVPHTTKSS